MVERGSWKVDSMVESWAYDWAVRWVDWMAEKMAVRRECQSHLHYSIPIIVLALLDALSIYIR